MLSLEGNLQLSSRETAVKWYFDLLLQVRVVINGGFGYGDRTVVMAENITQRVLNLKFIL